MAPDPTPTPAPPNPDPKPKTEGSEPSPSSDDRLFDLIAENLKGELGSVYTDALAKLPVRDRIIAMQAVKLSIAKLPAPEKKEDKKEENKTIDNSKTPAEPGTPPPEQPKKAKTLLELNRAEEYDAKLRERSSFLAMKNRILAGEKK